jgi:Ca2+-binding RTX toxin-like protein
MATKFGGNESSVILGTQRADDLRAGGGDDIVRGLGSNDSVRGDAGNDRLFGGDGDDRISGGSGDDGLNGGAGKDALFGNAGNDRLFGNFNDDKLSGGDGADELSGGVGNDTLRGDVAGGSKSADLFIFAKNSGKDVVVDFDVDRDILQISKGLNKISTAADVIKKSSQVGDDVVINLGDGNKITLKDVKLADLKDKPGDHFDVV